MMDFERHTLPQDAQRRHVGEAEPNDRPHAERELGRERDTVFLQARGDPASRKSHGMKYLDAIGRIRNFLLILCLIGPHMADSQTQTKQILDMKVDSFKTELEEVGNSFWVDDNQFVLTTLQEGAQRNVREEDTPSRIALVNFANKTIKFIAQEAQLLDFTFDRETRSIFVGRRHTSHSFDADGRDVFAVTYENLREIRIEPSGEVSEIKKYPLGSKPRDPEMQRPKDKGSKALDHGRGGYLVRDLKPGDTLEALNARDRVTDEGWPTTWVRAGKPDVSLPMRYDEIDSGVYVDFLNKYLLNDYDTSVTSFTNSHLNSIWKRPYEYTPFRLLSPDGSIEEIPYPQFVFDYGIAERVWQKGGGSNFSRFLITRAGIVIQKKREYGSALYLFKNNKLYLVAGGKTALHVDLAENSAEGIQTTKLSPDGCKIAYSHLHGLAASSKYQAPRFLSIINLCSDQK